MLTQNQIEDIRGKMKELGFSQATVAKRLGVRKQSISLLLCGNMTAKDLEKKLIDDINMYYEKIFNLKK